MAILKAISIPCFTLDKKVPSEMIRDTSQYLPLLLHQLRPPGRMVDLPLNT